MDLDLRRRGRALILLASLAAAPPWIGCRGAEDDRSHAAPAAEIQILDAQHAPLRADFDRDAAHPRIMVLASPT